MAVGLNNSFPSEARREFFARAPPFVLGHQTQTEQVVEVDLDGHLAAAAVAALAKAFPIANPG